MPFSPFFACCPSAQLPSSVQISSEKAGPLICSQEEPGPPTLSSVRSNLALSPWGWPCCSLFTATRLANRPWGQARASLEPSTLNSIWLRLENKDQDCFTLQGKLKTAKLKLHWNLVHSRDILSLNQFFTPTHSVYRCHGPQLQAVPWEPREGPGPGQPSSCGGGVCRQDGGLSTEGTPPPSPPSSAFIFPLSGTTSRGWCQWKTTPPCTPVIAASLQIWA